MRAALAVLIDNSIRFARPGQTPKIHVDAVSGEGGQLLVTFRDEGRGFSAGQDAYAGKRFSEPGRVSGAGLGLAICRIVVQRLGGTLHLTNASPPPGAVVILRLPEAR
jgi:signal transduction histidine kinase